MTPCNDIARRLDAAFASHADRPAISFDGISHTYARLEERVRAIHTLLARTAAPGERLIGVLLTDSVDTYAIILAVLRSGRAFVPINPAHPADRNASIVRQAELSTIVAPSAGVDIDGDVIGNARVLIAADATSIDAPDRAVVGADDLAYLLFTSGSTGEPKGVPISHGNLSAFLDALANARCAMSETDRVLQMFDLTFDFSISTYLAPLASGACIYPLSAGSVKFAEVYRLLEEERLTVAPMVPSVLSYLRPYFDDIQLPDLRLSFFCGEALHADVATEWLMCAPASEIVNFYGPTEATVFATYYVWNPAEGRSKTLNGVVSIGKPMQHNLALLVDEDLQAVPPGERGELCLGGPQVTPGYWKDEARNARTFFEHDIDGEPTRFYRTGDLALKDADGDYLFCGRVDHQVKLQGYRVELGEIEHHVKELLPGRSCVVVPHTNAMGNTEIRLVVENFDGDFKPVLASLRGRVPTYMVPPRAMSLPEMPLNANGKIDRRALQQMIEAERG